MITHCVASNDDKFANFMELGVIKEFVISNTRRYIKVNELIEKYN